MTARGEPPPAEPLLTPDEVCAWLRIGRRHLYRLVERGGVPHLKIGNRLRFERGEIGRWLGKRRQQQGGADVCQ